MGFSFQTGTFVLNTKIECLNLTGTDVPPQVLKNVGVFILFLAGISCPRAFIK
jgi:hypothetical protein